ncbi:hypothetical protein D9M68_897730 [compost metagenome]
MRIREAVVNSLANIEVAAASCDVADRRQADIAHTPKQGRAVRDTWKYRVEDFWLQPQFSRPVQALRASAQAGCGSGARSSNQVWGREGQVDRRLAGAV